MTRPTGAPGSDLLADLHTDLRGRRPAGPDAGVPAPEPSAGPAAGPGGRAASPGRTPGLELRVTPFTWAWPALRRAPGGIVLCGGPVRLMLGATRV